MTTNTTNRPAHIHTTILITLMTIAVLMFIPTTRFMIVTTSDLINAIVAVIVETLRLMWAALVWWLS